MSTVTVSGGAGVTLSLTYDSAANAGLATGLAGVIDQALASGRYVASINPSQAPTPPPGAFGEVVRTLPGASLLNAATKAVVVTGPAAVIVDGGAPGQAVLSGTTDLTYLARTGSGEIVTGAGPLTFVQTTAQAGNWDIHSGGGDDLIVTGAGSDTVDAGAGHNLVVLGSGANLVTSSGQDTISGGSGTALITTARGGDLVAGGSGKLTFIGGAAASSVSGGSGSVTVFGGAGSGEFRGGSAGSNVILAGTGRATLFGGGDGDQLFAEGGEAQVLRAAAGNETLDGSLSRGADAFYAGPGNTKVVLGAGQDTVFASSGRTTVTGGFGRAVAEFVDGRAGGSVLLGSFAPGLGDTIRLTGYGANERQNAINTQRVVGGATVVTLSDQTTITFGSAVRVDGSFFS